MTLAELKKTNPHAVEAWYKETPAGANRASAQPHHGKLFLVWNNGCYLEGFLWTGRRWQDLNREMGIACDVMEADIKWYNAGCKELSKRNLD